MVIVNAVTANAQAKILRTITNRHLYTNCVVYGLIYIGKGINFLRPIVQNVLLGAALAEPIKAYFPYVKNFIPNLISGKSLSSIKKENKEKEEIKSKRIKELSTYEGEFSVKKEIASLEEKIIYKLKTYKPNEEEMKELEQEGLTIEKMYALEYNMKYDPERSKGRKKYTLSKKVLTHIEEVEREIKEKEEMLNAIKKARVMKIKTEYGISEMDAIEKLKEKDRIVRI